MGMWSTLKRAQLHFHGWVVGFWADFQWPVSIGAGPLVVGLSWWFHSVAGTDWLEVPIPYIRPIEKGLNFREYPHNSYGQKYGTNTYLHVLDPEDLPLNSGTSSSHVRKHEIWESFWAQFHSDFCNAPQNIIPTSMAFPGMFDSWLWK
jgi:hypothetical protein